MHAGTFFNHRHFFALVQIGQSVLQNRVVNSFITCFDTWHTSRTVIKNLRTDSKDMIYMGCASAVFKDSTSRTISGDLSLQW